MVFIHCANCKYYKPESECMMWKATKIKPYEDYCSRAEWNDDDYEPPDIDSDLGYDPYLGCITDDV